MTTITDVENVEGNINAEIRKGVPIKDAVDKYLPCGWTWVATPTIMGEYVLVTITGWGEGLIGETNYDVAGWEI